MSLACKIQHNCSKLLHQLVAFSKHYEVTGVSLFCCTDKVALEEEESDNRLSYFIVGRIITTNCIVTKNESLCFLF